jgi:hypothetical protein
MSKVSLIAVNTTNAPLLPLCANSSFTSTPLLKNLNQPLLYDTVALPFPVACMKAVNG